MKYHLSPSALLLIWPVVQSLMSQCGEEEYPFRNKCCRNCAMGTEMKSRCSENSDSVCQPCEKGKYNDAVTVWSCKVCTICDRDSGLQEVRRCESTSDTVCVCLPGYEPADESDEKRCNPCPNGYFSKGIDKKCTPWTNCTAKGKKPLQAGTKEKDADCDDDSMVPLTTELTTKHPFTTKQKRAASVAKPTVTWSASSTLPTKSLPREVNKSEFLSYIFITAVLLLVLGGAILLKKFQKTGENKRSGRFMGQIHTDGKTSFRIPIQEEQIDSKPSVLQSDLSQEEKHLFL